MSTQKYRSYKDVPIPWIASIPEHWDWKPVLGAASERDENNKGMKEDNLLSLSYGNIVNKDINTSDGLLPESFETYQIVRPGDIILRLTDLQNDKRSLRSALVTQKGIITSAYLALKPESIDSKYLGYLLRAYDVSKVFYSMGGGLRQSMKYGDIKRMPLVIPSKTEQNQIAAFLDRETTKIHALIAEQKHLIELLQEKRQAVISHAVTKGLNPNAPMKVSGVEWLGDVPEHWKALPLRRLIRQVTSGTSVNAIDEPASYGQAGVLKTSCVYTGDFRPEENKAILESELDRATCPVVAGTLVVSRMNTPDLVGAAGLVKNNDPYLFLPDRLWLVSFQDCDPQFMNYWCKSVSYRSQVQLACSGTSSSMQNLSQDNFYSFIAPLPPTGEQSAIATFLDRETAKIDALKAEQQRLIELLQERRSALISAAVTGQIDVRGLVEAEAGEQ